MLYPAAPRILQDSLRRPAKKPYTVVLALFDLAIGSIQDPSRVNLPQRDEWVDVWADSSSVIAFRKQEAVKESVQWCKSSVDEHGRWRKSKRTSCAKIVEHDFAKPPRVQ